MNRSFRLDFEVVAAVRDEDVNARLAALFERDLSRSVRLEPARETLGITERLRANTARLLSPLL